MKETLSPFKRALQFVWKSAPGLTTFRFVLALLKSVFPVAMLYLTKLTIDAVTANVKAHNLSQAFGEVSFYIGLTILVSWLSVLCNTLAELVRQRQNLRVNEFMYDLLQSQSLAMDLEYYENPQYYDVLYRAQSEAQSRPMSILDSLMNVALSFLSLAFMGALLFAVHWAIPLLLLAATVPSNLVRLKFSKAMYLWQRQSTPEGRKSDYFNEALTTQAYAKEIRLFDLGALFKKSFLEIFRKLRHERMKLLTQQSVAGFVIEILSTAMLYGFYGYCAYRALHGAITLGDLVMYFQAYQGVLGRFQQIMSGLTDLHQHRLYLGNLFEFLDMRPKLVDPPHPRPLPCPLQRGLAFERVSFQYPLSRRQALDEVSLRIRPGEVVAFVGENGAGKTTLIKLLCRLYEPTTGRITIDGIDIRDFNLAELRRQFSVIFQDYVHYPLTAKENIWFGNIDLPSNNGRIQAAGHEAGIDPVIAGLPEGYETMLGKRFGKGEELSTGEWQKIALARAFFRQAPIIVLDEPTSAMDARAEYELFERFRRLIKNQTAILISHRFSTVQMADCIYVLEHGRITESGSHEELLYRNGTYARLYEMQARKYQIPTKDLSQHSKIFA
jgi:ATP-binding cassette subfamily B protein